MYRANELTNRTLSLVTYANEKNYLEQVLNRFDAQKGP